MPDFIGGGRRQKENHDWEQDSTSARKLIELFSNEGDVICDTFSGSGTIAKACKELNRNFIGAEIDKKHFDLSKLNINGNSNDVSDLKTIEETEPIKIEEFDTDIIKNIKAQFFQTANGIVFNSNCIGPEGMSLLKDKSVSAIIVDLPYGITKHTPIDTKIQFEPLWAEFLRIIKPRGAIVLFSSRRFTPELQNSKFDLYKYTTIWDKGAISDPQLSRKQPLRQHEEISIFSVGRTNYYPQGLIPIPLHKQKVTERSDPTKGNLKQNSRGEYTQKYTNFPRSIIGGFPKEKDPIHPFQKPVALIEYLIKTYSKEGETILDCCLGSGTTCVAATNTNRAYIGFEMIEYYYNEIKKRMGVID